MPKGDTMTTTNPTDSAPAAAPTTAAPVATSAQDLWAEIEGKANCKLGDAPVTLRFVWFPASPGGEPTVFSVGNAVPIKQDFLVFAIFHDADEARVYALPKVPKSDPTGLPARLVLSKHAAIVASEVLHPDVFVEVLAEELSDAAIFGDDDMGEDGAPAEE
jgi:hypothetical protein